MRKSSARYCQRRQPLVQSARPCESRAAKRKLYAPVIFAPTRRLLVACSSMSCAHSKRNWTPANAMNCVINTCVPGAPNNNIFEFAAFTIASAASLVMSPRHRRMFGCRARPRPRQRKRCHPGNQLTKQLILQSQPLRRGGHGQARISARNCSHISSRLSVRAPPSRAPRPAPQSAGLTAQASAGPHKHSFPKRGRVDSMIPLCGASVTLFE